MQLIIICFFILLQIFNIAAPAQDTVSFYSTSNSNNLISIPAGEKWKLICYSTEHSSASEAFAICTSTNNFNTRVATLFGTDSKIFVSHGPNVAAGSIFMGPLYIYPTTSQRYLITFERNAAVTQTISATAVVIPQSSTGDVDIKLEQSADNVTWTECLPGTYNSSTVKRFFRLRAVEK